MPRIEALGQDRNYAALWAPSPLSVFRQRCELGTHETSPDEPPLVARRLSSTFEPFEGTDALLRWRQVT